MDGFNFKKMEIINDSTQIYMYLYFYIYVISY